MEGRGAEEVEAILVKARERGIPMLVTNPDFLRPGTNDPMPGLIGKTYKARGGRVEVVGKPYDLVYDKCFSILQMDPSQEDKSSVCAVGDSLSHDIQGAVNSGLSSVFIASGVHYEELGVEQGSPEMPDPSLFPPLFASHLEGGEAPTHSTPSFRW
ncbi:unnamed protein product [Discosporangium mesarthrocarpum]